MIKKKQRLNQVVNRESKRSNTRRKTQGLLVLQVPKKLSLKKVLKIWKARRNTPAVNQKKGKLRRVLFQSPGNESSIINSHILYRDQNLKFYQQTK